MGMGGVQRATKFAKYLPSFGWQPIILTVKDVDYFAKDYTLLEELSSDTKVIRTGSFDPLRLSYLLKSIMKKNKKSRGETYTSLKAKILSWLFFPDNKIGWIPFALSKGLKICKDEKIDLIFSTSPPPSLHLIGYFLKKLTGKVWLADFRDEWIGYQYQFLSTPLHRGIKKALMKIITSNCDAIVTVSQEIGELIKENLSQFKFLEIIPNGFDQSDFKVKNLQKTEKFTITYLGTFSLDNDPQPFFKSLSSLLSSGKINSQKLKLVIVGLPLGIDLDKLITKYGLQKCVEYLGYLPHREAIKRLIESDLLLLTISGDPKSKSITPGKLFEYLATKKPILAILPKGNPAAEIIKSAKAGEVIEPIEIGQIENRILHFYQKYQKGEQEFNPDLKAISPFERKYLTSRLATLFDGVIR